jgi:hypothetical protein
MYRLGKTLASGVEGGRAPPELDVVYTYEKGNEDALRMVAREEMRQIYTICPNYMSDPQLRDVGLRDLIA